MSDPREAEPPTGEAMRRSYLRVLLAWLATLAALYAFQQYFPPPPR